MSERILDRRAVPPPVRSPRGRHSRARPPGTPGRRGRRRCPWPARRRPARAWTDRHLGQPARGGPQRRPGRGPVDRGLLGRPVRDLPGRHGPQPVAGHGGHGAEPVLHNFEIAAGLAEGRHRGPPWNDGDFYKWLEAAAARPRRREGRGPRPADGRGDRRHRPGPARRRLPPHAGPDQEPRRRSPTRSPSRTASTSRRTTWAT